MGNASYIWDGSSWVELAVSTVGTDQLVSSAFVDAKGDLIVGTAADTIARLPVGTNGYVLTANSAESSGLKWQPESGLVYATGYYYTYANTTNTTLTFTKDLMYLIPFYVPSTTTFTRIAVSLTGTAGSTGSVIRLGIYDSDSNNFPNNLVVDGGTVATTTTGSKSVTISQSLSKGLYWLASVAQVATTTQPTSTRRIITPTSFVQQGTVSADDAGLSNVNVGYTVSSVTGALPSTASGYALSTAIPVVYLGV